MTNKSPCGGVRPSQAGAPGEDASEPRNSLLESMRAQERELAEAYRLTSLGIWRWCIPTDTVTWSEQIYRMCGRNPEQPVPGFLEMKTMYTPESWERLSGAVDRAVQDGNPYVLDLKLVWPDGSPRWVAARGEVSARGSDGGVLELCGTMQDITERKLTEQRLARSEARYRSLVRASSDVVWTANPDGTQEETSAEWRALTGQSNSGPHGYGWSEAIHPDDRERTFKAWQRSVERGTRFQIEHRLQRHDGVYRWMRACAAPARDTNGSIVEWVGMHTDITEQVETEAALRDTQSRFQRLYEANILGIMYPDKSGGVSGGNDEFLRTIGYSREDLRAGLVRWDKMTPPEYLELDTQHIAEADERGMCTPYEKEYIRKDGTRVPILCGYALLSGSTENYIAFVMDLTVQKQTEQALREREQRFRELAETLPELIWVTGADGRTEYVNRRFVEYTGIPEDLRRGSARTDMIHPEDRDQLMSKWAHSVETGEPYGNTLRLRRHDGVYRTFLARAMPIRNPEGKIERWVGNATDVHEQRLAEETLRRTEKLAATGRLAASIAHEINNPLAAVTNALYLAMQMEISDEARGYLEMAEQELARVAQVTTQTLRFHRQSTAAVLADVGEIMDSAIALYASRLSSLGIALERRYRRRERVLCYADELRQVFANLLSNSLDATRRGGRIVVRIRNGCDWSEGGGRRGIRVALADTGSGIAPEVRQHLFEPFISTKDSTGTGLGLWVSDGIMRKHGGRIAVRSRTSQPAGTVFMLFLPLLPADPELTSTFGR